MRIVQLMTGFDGITKDNEHLLRPGLQLWFYLNDPVTIMIFDTDHKFNLSAKCHFNIYGLM